jgi:hypothetical protein
MLVNEAGPFQVFARFRALTKLGGILDCLYCCSVWVAAGLVLVVVPITLAEFVLWTLAVSGGAVIVSVYTGVNFRTPEGVK